MCFLTQPDVCFLNFLGWGIEGALQTAAPYTNVGASSAP